MESNVLEQRLQAIEGSLSKIQKDLRRSRQWTMFRVIVFNILPIALVVVFSIPIVQALKPAVESIRSLMPSAGSSTASSSFSAKECRLLCDRLIP
ncbi:hypothetical protein HZA86_00590 [Candidatus Uhrbacteria bacterium]|nr:hypothetical protein [Candidatus Uhrbacteria bacterium]